MDTIEIIAQAIGIIAMVMNVLSFQQKTQRGIIFFLLCGGALFTINFIMLDALVGGLLNLVGVIRGLIYLNKEKFHADHPLWIVGFSLAYIATYVLTFTVFDKEPSTYNLIVEMLPVIGMIIGTISFSMKNAKGVRLLSLIGSPFWLAYNIFSGAIGAIACEIFAEISIVIGMLRYDIKRGKTDEENTEITK